MVFNFNPLESFKVIKVPYFPFMNGQIERQNRNIIKGLQTARIDDIDWRKALQKRVYLLVQ